MSAYYNEFDPFAAAWLRELIAAGAIAPGDVDERSITEVTAADLAGYTQCHFFAGIGGWSRALRLAGWADARPVWTGSCPCQPFSAAGKGKGGTDDRHLWPHWARLIRECRPVTVFGEQVESAIGHGWLDAVFDDLEGEGYAIGAACLPAASVGAPHIRQRLWFVAESTHGSGRERERNTGEVGSPQRKEGGARNPSAPAAPHHSATSELADTNGRDASNGHLQRRGQHGLRADSGCANGGAGDEERAEVGELADTDGTGRFLSQCDDEAQRRGAADRQAAPRHDVDGRGAVHQLGHAQQSGLEGLTGDGRDGREPGRVSQAPDRPTPATGAWDDLVWLPCRDGKARPTQSSILGIFDGLPDELGYVRDPSGQVFLSPLVQKATNRVGRLRGYGNAIASPVAAEFIKAYLDIGNA